MSVLIVGANGNMGMRYRAIFDHLGVGYLCADISHTIDQMRGMSEGVTGILIATPTHMHAKMILGLADLRIPILCEKPISKNIAEVIEALRAVAKYATPFSMVYQYAMLPIGNSGLTKYDYFKHGGDTLVWDCIQLVGLAKGDIELDERSPVWNCSINGRKQDIGDMDRAYIHFIKSWMRKPEQDVGYLRDLHAKTLELDKNYGPARHH